MKVSNLFLDNWILIVYLYNEIKYRIKGTICHFDFWKARQTESSRKGILSCYRVYQLTASAQHESSHHSHN